MIATPKKFRAYCMDKNGEYYVTYENTRRSAVRGYNLYMRNVPDYKEVGWEIFDEHTFYRNPWDNQNIA